MGVKNYLTDEEELQLQWKGQIDSESSSSLSQSSSTFGATDKRLVYLDSNGGFKDIEYTHISSIESEVEKEIKNIADFDGNHLAVGGLGFLIAMGGFSIESGAVILFGCIIAAIVAILNMEEVQKTKVITGDEAHSQLEFKTSDNVSADLSRIIREHS